MRRVASQAAAAVAPTAVAAIAISTRWVALGSVEAVGGCRQLVVVVVEVVEVIVVAKTINK